MRQEDQGTSDNDPEETKVIKRPRNGGNVGGYTTASERFQRRPKVTPVTVYPASPKLLPARVVYTMDGELIAAPSSDPDLPPPVYATVPTLRGLTRLENGLSPRADIMARYVARNEPISDAFRAAYDAGHLSPSLVAFRSARVSRVQQFDNAVASYRVEMEREQKQTVVSMRNFVTGTLVKEAQSADVASARIRAAELLGKTQGMFVDVKRVETFTSSDVSKMKAQLNQRLSELLATFAPRLSPSHGDNPDTPSSDPTAPVAPLLDRGTHDLELHINIDRSSPNSPLGGGGQFLQNSTDGTQSEIVRGYLSELDPESV